MTSWASILEPAREGLPEALRQRPELVELAARSPWAGTVLAQDPDPDAWVPSATDLARPRSAEAIQRSFHSLHSATDAAELMQGLRRVRQREMLQVAAGDLLGHASLENTLAALTAIADAAIATAHDWLEAHLRERFGTPRDAEGRAQSLVVLGMGKLGGGELNFSSDVDLVFVYPERGQTDGARRLDNEEFFTRLGRELIRVLDEMTPGGRVFRVDLRLRPFGASGPLVMSFNGAETYYQLHGREWERYALIKARPVAGDRAAGERLLADLAPFVYRRYLDYSVFESLREMKQGIVREVARRGLEDNVKLGRGGIREVEFVVQLFQLLRGGREPELRQRGLRPGLAAVVAAGHLSEAEGESLAAAYEFLRCLENRIQALHDHQTHELPTDPADRLRLLKSMSLEEWSSLEREFESHRHAVREIFEDVFTGPEGKASQSSDEGLEEDLWHGRLEAERAREVLAGVGYREPAVGLERLQSLQESGPLTRMGARGRRRMDQLMPRLIRVAGALPEPDRSLERSLRVLLAIARRTAYLALLLENPQALEQLARLCGRSAWVADRIAEQPLLLDELIDPRLFQSPPGPEQRARELDAALERVAGDREREMEALREWHQSAVFRVAVAELSDALDVLAASEQLSGIAELALERTWRMALADLVARHGHPCREGSGEAARFAVIGYGKLGGREMSYGSDLDLVFLHDSPGGRGQTDGSERPVDNNVFFSRLAQRMIHMLSTQTPAGRLYEVDTRLRPSGSAGLLVSSLEAFAQYQQEKAWTWEHQALLRARPVCGDGEVCEAFQQVRRDVLSRRREGESLAEQIRAMRQRMIAERGADRAAFDCKRDPGGLLDVEFIVQYLSLAHAAEHPGLLESADTLGLLEGLAEHGCIDLPSARELRSAVHGFRRVIHAETLSGAPGPELAEQVAGDRERVIAVWDRLLSPMV